MTPFSIFEMVDVARCFIPHLTDMIVLSTVPEGYELKIMQPEDILTSGSYRVTEHMVSGSGYVSSIRTVNWSDWS